MRALRTASQILLLPPLATLLYDLVKEWFVYNRVKVRSLEKFWTWLHDDSYDAMRPVFENVLGSNWTTKLMNMPAPLALLIPPVVLYVIYWIWFKIKGGNSTGAFTYKSHD